MKTEWNPLDIPPAGELTLHGDARLLDEDEIPEGGLLLVNGSPYRVLGVTDDGDSVTYKLEPTWLGQ